MAKAHAAPRILLVLGLAATPGCVERSLLVRTDPPVAEVFVDGREVGRTAAGAPLRVPFDFYGTRTVTARATGHVPLRRDVTLDPPWWQVPPFDLFTDLLWPGTLVDEHEVDLVLSPRAAPEDPAALERRARAAGESEERRP